MKSGKKSYVFYQEKEDWEEFAIFALPKPNYTDM